MAIGMRPTLPVLDSKSPPPALFDGTTRLYISLNCPYAQRTWIARNFKGLENIELVPINLQDKPTWYLEKVYPPGKVPSLEHNGKVTGESLDLLDYIEKNFAGPTIFPTGSAKEAAAKELLKYSDEMIKQFFSVIRNKEATKSTAEETLGPGFDHLEAALSEFCTEGPYFLGTISAVDFAYAPFMERFDILLPEFINYEPLSGRPKLTQWFEAMNTVDAYTSTKLEPDVLVSTYKKFMGR